jgi:hypothetical protein
LKRQYYPDYAEYLADFLEYYHKELNAGANALPATDDFGDGDRLKISIPMGPVVVLVGRGNGHVLRRNGAVAQSLVRKGADLQFQLEGTTLVPFYQLGSQEPYQMYFDLQI